MVVHPTMALPPEYRDYSWWGRDRSNGRPAPRPKGSQLFQLAGSPSYFLAAILLGQVFSSGSSCLPEAGSATSSDCREPISSAAFL